MSESDFNEQLLARFQAGDEHAFVELYSHHRDRLKQMIEFRMDRRLRGREDASDILQDVYIDAHQRLRHYLKRPELSFYIWLRQLTTQRLIDIHRRHLSAEKRDVKQEVSISRPFASATSASMAVLLVARLASPSQMAMQAEMVVQIEKGLEKMDPIDREVLALRHFEELRNCEVAEVLGIKEAAASNRYVRALSRLRDLLEELPDFGGEHQVAENRNDESNRRS
jgi:RNA polymerase sigma-70 factor (ECF subfamily)